MKYAAKVYDHFNTADDSWYWDFRSRLFPTWILGEVSGWHGVREKEIERWLAT
jgi:hypothetical protein